MISSLPEIFLLYPSTIFTSFVENSEAMFCLVFPSIMYLNSWLKGLLSYCEWYIDEISNCTEANCRNKKSQLVEMQISLL